MFYTIVKGKQCQHSREVVCHPGHAGCHQAGPEVCKCVPQQELAGFGLRLVGFTFCNLLKIVLLCLPHLRDSRSKRDIVRVHAKHAPAGDVAVLLPAMPWLPANSQTNPCSDSQTNQTVLNVGYSLNGWFSITSFCMLVYAVIGVFSSMTIPCTPFARFCSPQTP